MSVRATHGDVLAPLGRTSKLAVGLAVGASVTVAAAAVAGYTFAAPEVLGALAVAGIIAFLNFRARPQSEPHVLTALPQRWAEAVVAAPRAGGVAAHPAGSARADAA